MDFGEFDVIKEKDGKEYCEDCYEELYPQEDEDGF